MKYLNLFQPENNQSIESTGGMISGNPLSRKKTLKIPSLLDHGQVASITISRVYHNVFCLFVWFLTTH